MWNTDFATVILGSPFPDLYTEVEHYTDAEAAWYGSYGESFSTRFFSANYGYSDFIHFYVWLDADGNC